MQYIIDGIEGDDVSKLILYSAKDICEFKSKLDEFEKIKVKSKVSDKTDNFNKIRLLKK